MLGVEDSDGPQMAATAMIGGYPSPVRGSRTPPNYQDVNLLGAVFFTSVRYDYKNRCIELWKLGSNWGV